MSPDEFKDNVLGWGSSHPDWQARRQRLLRAAALVPVSVLVLFSLLSSVNFGNWLGRLMQRSIWPAAIGALMAALVGAWLTTIFSDRGVAIQRARGQKGDPGAERIRIDPRWLVVGLLLACVGPFLFLQLLPKWIRVLFYLVSFAMLLGLAISLYRPWLQTQVLLGPSPLTPSPLTRRGGEGLGVRGASETEEPATRGTDQPPAWLRELLANLPEGCRSSTWPQLLKDGETSPIVPNTGLETIFGGVSPTADQQRVFQRFVESYRELVIGTGPASGGRGVEPSADLLVEGDPGSGKTTSLIACALYAAFVRGQRVLFVVPDEIRQAVVKQRIDAFLKNGRLHYYVSCAVITPGAVAEWLGEDSAIPHILVGTPASIEEHLYGAPARQDQQFELLRKFILLLENIFVDDFTDFEDAERSHLPFLIDKQRLLLDAEYLPLQVVVSEQRLAGIGRAILGTRLFTEKRLKLESNVLTVRPRPSGRAWRVDLTATDLAAAVDRMIEWCLKKDLDVVLYRRGIDEHERQRKQTELIGRGGTGRITVISDLDQPVEMPDVEVDAVFYQVAIHQDVCLALRLRMGHDDTVIFSLTPEGESREVIDSGIVPVIVDRTAPALVGAHLRSALRYLRPASPVHVDVWQQFGIRDERSVVGIMPNMLEFDDWSNDSNYGSDLWPYVALRRPGQRYEPINVRSLSAGQHNESSKAKAAWKTSAGQVLQELDLVHLREVRLVYGTEVYVAEDVRQTPDGIEFITQNWQGNGYDAYLPIFEIEWNLPTGQTTATLGGGSDFSLAWVNLDLPAEHDAARVQTAITALMTEYGFVKDISPVRFSYPARLSALIFNPQPLDRERLRQVQGESLAGQWRTTGDPRFLPALTGALNYAFHARVPGLAYFARTLAFSLTGDAQRIGSAVAFFLEPLSGGRTVMRVLSRLLTDARERRGLFQSVEWFLEQLRASKTPQRFLHRFARAGFQGDEQIGNVGEALALISSILGRAEVQLGLSKEEAAPASPRAPSPPPPVAVEPQPEPPPVSPPENPPEPPPESPSRPRRKRNRSS